MTEAPRPEKNEQPGRLDETKRTFQPRLWAGVIAISAIGLYALLFVVFNTGRVDVDFVFTTLHVSLIWVILLSLVVGVVFGMLLSQLHRRRQRRR